jgi:SAM-dependent methyltransferase
MNINTRSYWDGRFGSGDWATRGGFSQTLAFAEAQIPLLGIDSSFEGSLCDFGCGAGDAFPTYRRAWPKGKLCGIDFSAEAIRLAATRFGDIATFLCGEACNVPPSDVVIASNVLEHVDDDEAVVAELLPRCKKLYVVVPFRERVVDGEHVRSYDRGSFSRFAPAALRVFVSRGWSRYGVDLWWNCYAKNLPRFLLGRRLARQHYQVMFIFRGFSNHEAGPLSEAPRDPLETQ